MSASVSQLNKPAPNQPCVSPIAGVVQAEGGQALRVLGEGASLDEPVLAHLSGVPTLGVGDRVLLKRISEGVIVVGRLRRPGEPAAAVISEEDGMVRIDGGRSLRLRSGKSVIELAADGAIRVDGREIYSFAEGRLCLQGATLELN